MPTRVRSFCKINLGLAVGPPRLDGFHALTTLYQTLGLHDLVTVSARTASTTRITVAANHPGVPCTAAGNSHRNTAFRMVDAALTALGQTAEVHITLSKRLPVQGGLGAGSANAAAALLGLERELGCALPAPQRLTLAARIGSDVPLFLLGGTVLGLNRGEAVYPLPNLPTLPVVVAIPSVGVSTPEAFRALDRRLSLSTPAQSDLTTSSVEDRIAMLSRTLASAWSPSGVFAKAERAPNGIASSARKIKGDLAGNPLLALVHTGVDNDFEDVAFQQHPSLRDIKHVLAGSPDGSSKALYAALSGSGSALFGIYADLKAAQAAQQRVQSLGTRALLTETLTREELWRRSFA